MKDTIYRELLQQQELLKSIVDDASVGVIVSDNNTYEILYINGTALTLFDKEPDSYEGKRCYQYLYGRQTPCPYCKKEKLNPTTSQIEGDYQYKNRYFLTQGRLVKWAGRDAHIEYLSDITESKTAEIKLKDIIHTVPGGICLYRWDGVKLHPLVISDRLSDILGVNAEESLEELPNLDFAHFARMSFSLK